MSSPAPAKAKRPSVDPVVQILAAIVGALILFVGIDHVVRVLHSGSTGHPGTAVAAAYAVDQRTGCQYEIVRNGARLEAKMMRRNDGSALCGPLSH